MEGYLVHGMALFCGQLKCTLNLVFLFIFVLSDSLDKIYLVYKSVVTASSENISVNSLEFLSSVCDHVYP